ncbi:MAG: 50S ribosomal protein L25/general stress protein Ctc [Chlorobiaceae bacterium]|nr:50S ribosomal protein L25/general stress protein Ctc [Chlorobiaceae bacterium]NTV26465.1 50S ribosomal protein L25/general stress protein Ctc [Chlorobiaceae bacterium]
METRVLSVNLREAKKKEAAKLRREGQVPAVVYHKGEETVTISVEEMALTKLVHSAESHLIDLQYPDGKTTRSFIKDIQFDPVTDRVIHADFQLFSADEVVEMEVPLHFEGEAQGVKIGGGKLQINLHALTLKGNPEDMPEHFTVDVSGLALGQTLHIRELELGALAGKVTILGEADAPVVSVMAPRKEVEAAAEEAPAQA